MAEQLQFLLPDEELNNVKILLADDDRDDCLLFNDALSDLPVITNLTTVFDGKELMNHLSQEKLLLPQILFLDINMPFKNGIECLTEIKRDEKLSNIPIVIFSTSYEQEMVRRLYKMGAHYYIRKPRDFRQLKKVIYDALTLIARKDFTQPAREKFVLNSF